MVDPVRRDAIVRLLEQLHTGLPEATARPLSTAGFVHDATARESCPDCLANEFVSRDCETCGGRGFLEQHRRRDPYDTGRHIGALGATEVAREAVRRRDRELVTLERQLAPPPKTEADQLAQANAAPPAWVRARAALRHDFDFVPLERALEVLRDVDADAHRAVYAVHVHGWLPQEGRAATSAERGLALLDAWMPPAPIVIRAPERVVAVTAEERSLAARNLRIGEEHDAGRGKSTKRLAREHGLSVSQVNRILSGGEA